MSFAEEAFAGVALHKQTLVLITKLVPQGVEFTIVWPMHDMTEFVKHRVSDLLDRKELVSVAWIAKPQQDLLAPIYI